MNDAWIRANCTEGPWLIPKMKDTNCGNLYVRQGHSPLGRMQKIDVITDVIATCLRTTVTPICNNERIISPEEADRYNANLNKFCPGEPRNNIPDAFVTGTMSCNDAPGRVQIQLIPCPHCQDDVVVK